MRIIEGVKVLYLEEEDLIEGKKFEDVRNYHTLTLEDFRGGLVEHIQMSEIVIFTVKSFYKVLKAKW